MQVSHALYWVVITPRWESFFSRTAKWAGVGYTGRSDHRGVARETSDVAPQSASQCRTRGPAGVVAATVSAVCKSGGPSIPHPADGGDAGGALPSATGGTPVWSRTKWFGADMHAVGWVLRRVSSAPGNTAIRSCAWCTSPSARSLAGKWPVAVPWSERG